MDGLVCMVTLEQLAALDLVIWLGSSDRAAAFSHANQSTISRRSRAALQMFGLHLHRGRLGRSCEGDMTLLQLQRLVHQHARLQGRQPLRLQMPYWTRRIEAIAIPAGWCATPPDPALACEDPIGLLRDRVIDACVITSCQLPFKRDDLLLLELYRRPIELTLFSQNQDGSELDRLRRHRDHGALRLESISFLPDSCSRNAARLFEVLTGTAPPNHSCRQRIQAEQEEGGVSVAFLTPEMRAVQRRPWRVDDALEANLYVERLAVLAEHAQQPAVLQLLDQLVPTLASLSA